MSDPNETQSRKEGRITAPAFQIIAAGLCWGFIPVFYRMMSSSGLGRLQTITLRFSFAALGYILWLMYKDPGLLRLKRPAHILYFVGTGVISLAAFNFCYISCIKYAGVAVAALLLYTAPAFVLVMGLLLFKEQLTVRGVLALVMTVFGCAFVSGIIGGGASISTEALLWGLGSGFGYALYSVFSKYALKHYKPETITAYTAVFASLSTLPFSEPEELACMLKEPKVLTGALGSAIICTVLAYLLYTSGLERTGAGKAAILSTVEPVTACVLGVLLLHEPITPDKLSGILLVLLAIAVLNIPDKHKRGEKGVESCRMAKNFDGIFAVPAGENPDSKQRKDRRR